MFLRLLNASILYIIWACELPQVASKADHHNMCSWNQLQNTGISEHALNQAMIQRMTITWPAAKKASNLCADRYY